ncbi:MAG: DNA repair protein RecN [Anaerolineaceae bacterium]|nr:DNA repair protein RecN [Anaerolineaceae bacterium]
MLEELQIRNLAVIEDLGLVFGPGFNVITGETGAGKSLLVDALGLALGRRADPVFVRADAESASVEACFRLDDATRANLEPLLRAEELDDEVGSSLLLTRVLRRNGRSTARVNGIAVRSGLLKALGEEMVDIHGQSDHLSLLRPATHIDLLDRHANLLDQRAAVARLVGRLQATRAQLGQLQLDEGRRERRAEQLRREVAEIEAVAPQPDEDERLRQERARLGNSEQLAQLGAEAQLALSGDERGGETPGALEQLMQAEQLLARLARIDPQLEEGHALADALAQQVQELTGALQDYRDRIEHNPQRLADVEQRLEAINTLRRRFGATIQAVLAHADEARAQLDALEHNEQQLLACQAEENRLLADLGRTASALSRARREAGQKLARQVMSELADLRMGGTRFEVSIAQQESADGCLVEGRRLRFDRVGIDRLQFLMSANPGQPPQPLAKVASGGEAARLMLALKHVLARADRTPALIFDEIDQGIGGRVGAVAGYKLRALGDAHQVLAVTHLAQLAACADRHYRVDKDPADRRARATVQLLQDEEGRVAELASMLGAAGDSGRQTARELLQAAARHATRDAE